MQYESAQQKAVKRSQPKANASVQRRSRVVCKVSYFVIMKYQNNRYESPLFRHMGFGLGVIVHADIIYVLTPLYSIFSRMAVVYVLMY